MAGLRMEYTDLETSGFNWNIDENGKETLDPTGKFKNDYISWLPSFLVKWDATDDLKVRASYTKTLARPKYSHLVANASYNTEESPVEITLGNPDLKPITSHNFDLSGEYYFKSGGQPAAQRLRRRPARS